MRTFLVTTALLLAAANPASAKLLAKIEIQVVDDNEGKVARSLREGMEAKLNSTERYGVTTDPVATNLLINVNCIMLENRGGYTNGIVCDSEVTYFPYEDSALPIDVEKAGHMVVGGPDNITFVVDALMNRFINGTTDSVLAERKSFIRRTVQSLCVNHPRECKPPAK